MADWIDMNDVQIEDEEVVKHIKEELLIEHKADDAMEAWEKALSQYVDEEHWKYRFYESPDGLLYSEDLKDGDTFLLDDGTWMEATLWSSKDGRLLATWEKYNG